MTQKRFSAALLTAALAIPLASLAQERGPWRAASTSARSITGDLAFSGEKVSINFASFTLAQIRTLTPQEILTLFNPDDGSKGTGNLYRVSIPSTRLFLHKNSLCGGEETDWIATYVSGHTLQTALFSQPAIPELTPEAITNGARLCGTFTYVR